MHGGEHIHNPCFDAVKREMAAIDELDGGNAVPCDHCGFDILPGEPTWSSFEMFMHESCKSEHLTVMEIPHGTNLPRPLTIAERLRWLIEHWSNYIFVPSGWLDHFDDTRYDDRS